MTSTTLLALLACIGAGELPGPDALPSIPDLADPFLRRDGTRVATPAEWAQQREEIRETLLAYQYGHLPPAPGNVRVVEESAESVYDGAATERRVMLSCGPNDALRFELTLTIPNNRPGPLPVILYGDRCWRRPPIIEEVAQRGYLLAEFDRTLFAPDKDATPGGARPLYPDYDWATLAAWAWGFHRAVDYLLTREDVDPQRIGVTGHSRGGKAALLAGMLDERIALTAPNDSGCGGTGSYRLQGEGSEDIAAITERFPYWFHPRLRQFVGHVDRLPFDQHFAQALVAPRALLCTNALGDLWANPEGTQRTYLATREVYRFLGVPDRIGIQYRPGEHKHKEEDWRVLLDFADRHFFGREVQTRFDTLAFPDAPKGFSWSAPEPR